MVKVIVDIRVQLELQRPTRDLALLDLGIDSKLRACNLVKLCVRDVVSAAAGLLRSAVSATGRARRGVTAVGYLGQLAVGQK